MPTSILATSEAPLRGTRGFTLIEIALVLVILSILLSFVAPRLLDLTLVRREASAERLATVLGYLHDEASLRGQTFRLTIDIDDSRYFVERLAPDGQVVDEGGAESTPHARDQALPQGVQVA
ncbi:MAG: prepilin-type N-terminal cleavage/methylation domain-containing protein, partial [Myxococcales bacterium]